MAHVAVIGAGPAGLPAIKELLAEGHSVACYEQAPGVGGLFRYDKENGQIWKSLRLTSSAPITSFSDYPMSDDLPQHATHEQYTAYLNDYCDHFELRPHISFETKVQAVERQEDGSWLVRVAASDGSTSESRFDAVAVCSGLHQHPYSPELPGQEDFKGEFFHASKYREQAPFEGRSVVFVGLGESGADVVAEVSEVTKHAWLSLRRPASPGGSPPTSERRGSSTRCPSESRGPLPAASPTSVAGRSSGRPCWSQCRCGRSSSSMRSGRFATGGVPGI